MSESLDRYEVDVLDDLSATYSNAAGRWCKIIVDIKFHCTGRLYARGRILNFSPSKQCHQPAIIPRATFYLRENRPYNLCHLRSSFLYSVLSFVSVFPCSTARTWPYNSSCFMLCASYTYRLCVAASAPMECLLGFYYHLLPHERPLRGILHFGR